MYVQHLVTTTPFLFFLMHNKNYGFAHLFYTQAPGVKNIFVNNKIIPSML